MGSRSPQDKSHYTVDEMMDRLKDAQAVKDGRSRRRRTQQPNQVFQRSLVKVTIGLAILLAIVAVVVFAVGKFNQFRYGGEKFRDAAGERFSELSGFDVKLGKFEVDGRSIGMREAWVTGAPGVFLREVQLGGIQAVVSTRSFFGADWYVDKFDAFEVSMVVGGPEWGAGAGGGDAAKAGGLSLAGDAGGGGMFGLSSRPGRVVTDVIRLRNASVFWGEKDGPNGIKGVGLAAEVFSGETKLHGSGGTLSLEGFPDWEVQNLAGKLAAGTLVLEQSRFTVGLRDELELKGEIDLGRGGGVDLEGAVEGLALTELLPEFWDARIEGEMSSEFSLVIDRSSDNAAARAGVFEGTFELDDFKLRGLELFDTLAVFAGEHALSFIELPSVKGKFRRANGVVTLSDFESVRAGLLRLRGEITVADGQLGGVVEVGLPEAMFGKLVGGRPPLFEVDGEGFAWAKVNLSGDLEAPGEDLSAKLLALVRARAEGAPAAPGAGEAAAGGGQGAPPAGAGGSGAGATPEEERKKQLESAFENLINGQ